MADDLDWLQEDPIGGTWKWPCGHQAIVLGFHDLSHPHHCPVCDGRREPGCDVEYLDPH